MPIDRNRYPAPENADVQRCKWYGDARIVDVHLWGDGEHATDSVGGRTWTVRKCLICDRTDSEFLKQQHDAFIIREERYQRWAAENVTCGIDGCEFTVELGEGRTMALHQSEDHVDQSTRT